MNQAPPIGSLVAALAIDHIAYPSYDAARTHHFYVDVMGFTLQAAQTGTSRLWGKPYLLVNYAITAGESLAFFCCDGLAPISEPDTPASQIHHVALKVPDRDSLERWQARFERYDIPFHVEPHGDGDHLYLFDPNGVMLELCVRHPAQAIDEVDATEVLQRWLDGVR